MAHYTQTAVITQKESGTGSFYAAGRFADGTGYSIRWTGTIGTMCVGKKEQSILPGCGPFQTKFDGNVYEIFVEAEGRCPLFAFETQNEKMILSGPHLLSPENWKQIAKAMARIGYDTGEWTECRKRFTQLCKINQDHGRDGYTLQPDQKKVIETLFAGKTKHTVNAKLELAVEKEAIRQFGTTSRPRLAGFITRSGALLRLSHDWLTRDLDHRTVGSALRALHEDEGLDGTELMYKFISLGNIRLQQDGIHLSRRPEGKQRQTLLRVFEQMDCDEIFVDFLDPESKYTQSESFPGTTSPSRILSAIDHYYTDP